MIKVTIWNEYHHEQENPAVASLYPEGIHGEIAKRLKVNEDFQIRTATLEEPEHGLPQDVVDDTDVMLWWGHCRHDDVSDEVVERVQKRVLEGMGLLVLHSGHFSKIFRRLMGTHCSLRWREAAEKERLWNLAPHHPITQGIGDYFEIPHTEMYGERFEIPEPQELIFVSWFAGGEVFRSGCTWTRGNGKIFYFRPGHETYPIYHHETVIQILANGIRWANPEKILPYPGAPMCDPLEEIPDNSHLFGSAGIQQDM